MDRVSLTARRELDGWIGAVIVPQIRVGGTIAGPDPIVPSDAYLDRFPPAAVIAFGRTPSGPKSPSTLLSSLRSRCDPPPLSMCDLEQGAGLHFEHATRLPPAMALASADEAAPKARWIERAGELTALEAIEHGVELVLAPVADVNTRRDNPIIGVRSFGADERDVARRAASFLDGLHQGGALGCAKHFPGHGDTDQDSHRELARVARDADGLRAIDFAPFRALIERGVDAVMIAHVDAPAITGEEGLPTSLSRRAIEDVLRGELGFRGVVLSDAMDMGALASIDRPHARALAAGCDGLVCPRDPAAVADELASAVESGALDRGRLQLAARRMRDLRGRLARRGAKPMPERAVRERLALDAAIAALRATERWPWRLGGACEVLAPFPEGIGAEARAAIARLRREIAPSTGSKACVVPVVAEVRAHHGRYGLSPDEERQLVAKVADLRALGWHVGVLWFASPQSLPREPLGATLLAFAPTPPMVAAAGEFLRGRARRVRSLPNVAG